MCFNPIYKLHKVVEYEWLRPAMNYVYFNNGFAYATNGHACVRVRIDELIQTANPEELALLNNKGIHGCTYSKIYRLRNLQLTDDGFVSVDAYGNKTVYCLTDFDNFDAYGAKMKYPNVDVVIDGMLSDIEFKKGHVPFNTVAFDAKTLSELCSAMGSVKHPVLQSGKNTHAFRVQDNDNQNNDDVVAILMPIIPYNEK